MRQMQGRRDFLWWPAALVASAPLRAQQPAQLVPATAESPPGMALLEALRAGGLVMFFRHADTSGQPCDSSYRIGDRAGQRNLSALGRDQARRIGLRLRGFGVQVQMPMLAGPVFRARDTAEEAFGAPQVEVVEGLLADDYAGRRLDFVLTEHARLFATPPRLPGQNVVLVGHRTPAIMLVGPELGGRALPEGAALVLRPLGQGFEVLGVLDLVPVPWWDAC
jgi:phosphohistidine phosphatase SixA